MNNQLINRDLIAPCGMDCGVCKAHLREENTCPGCKNNPTLGYCQNCKMRNCTERTSEYCYDCAQFPCTRLKQLDKRYRTKYDMSEIENLEHIRDCGMETFLESERNKYQSEKGIFCVHDKNWY